MCRDSIDILTSRIHLRVGVRVVIELVSGIMILPTGGYRVNSRLAVSIPGLPWPPLTGDFTLKPPSVAAQTITPIPITIFLWKPQYKMPLRTLPPFLDPTIILAEQGSSDLDSEECHLHPMRPAKQRLSYNTPRPPFRCK